MSDRSKETPGQHLLEISTAYAPQTIGSWGSLSDRERQIWEDVARAFLASEWNRLPEGVESVDQLAMLRQHEAGLAEHSHHLGEHASRMSVFNSRLDDEIELAKTSRDRMARTLESHERAIAALSAEFSARLDEVASDLKSSHIKMLNNDERLEKSVAATSREINDVRNTANTCASDIGNLRDWSDEVERSIAAIEEQIAMNAPLWQKP